MCSVTAYDRQPGVRTDDVNYSGGPSVRRARRRIGTRLLSFDSSDLGETEDFLVRNYTKMRISGEAGEPRARIRRRWLGEVSIDELAFGYDMSFDADPLGRVMLCRVHQGRIEQQVTGAEQDVFVPGDLMLISPPDLPHGGRVCDVGYDLTGFEPTMLDRVATSAPDDGGSVRLTKSAARLVGGGPPAQRLHRLSA